VTGVYLDTSLFVALVFIDDEYHDRAIDLVRQVVKGVHGRPVQTTTAVIIETAAIIHRKTKGVGKRERACQKVRRIFDLIEGYKIELNILEKELVNHARQLYGERNGYLDFVDTLNVTYLRVNNVKKIVSFDTDYDQFSSEGIVRIN